MSVVDKFKGDQKALQEVIKEVLDRQGIQREQISNLQQAISDVRHQVNAQGSQIEAMG
jgi:hypothetical protein